MKINFLKLEEPLVSVVAFSYNQSETIVETLDSIFDQEYKNIELVIADDGSLDDTKLVVKNWLSEKGYRFNGAFLLESECNKGICNNVSKGIDGSKGEWIKPIACDDILCRDAIGKYLEMVKSNGLELIFSQMVKFKIENGKRVFIENYLKNNEHISLLNNPKRLLEMVRTKNYLPAPSAFYSREIFNRAGGIDTRFRYLEDWPLWLRIIPLVDCVGWIEKPLVLYRISEKSISQSENKSPISSFLYDDLVKLNDLYQKNYGSKISKWDVKIRACRNKFVFEKLGNVRLAYNILIPLQLLSPLAWFKILRKLVDKTARTSANIIPIFRGFYYFGFRGFLNRVRVFGRISIRMDRSRINIGRRLVVHDGVSLVANSGCGTAIELGDFVTLEKSSYIHAQGGKVIIGNNVHIGVGCVLQGHGDLIVGDNTMFGPYSQVYSSNHRSSIPPISRHLLGEKPRKVVIGTNCWVAANCIILPGSEIAPDSTLPAFTVVKRNDDKI